MKLASKAIDTHNEYDVVSFIDGHSFKLSDTNEILKIFNLQRKSKRSSEARPSLAHLIYFFLMRGPKSKTELSILLYGKKKQHARINDVLQKFKDKVAYQEELPKFESDKRDNSSKSKLWLIDYTNPVYNPIIELYKLSIEQHKELSVIWGDKWLLTDEEAIAFAEILKSEWFKTFLSDEYISLEFGRLIEEYGGHRGVYVPRNCNVFTYFGTLISELAAIRKNMEPYVDVNISPTIEKINSVGFDKALIEAEKKTHQDHYAIRVVENVAQRMTEHNYPRFKVIFGDYGVFAIPYTLAIKLAVTGRKTGSIDAELMPILKEESCKLRKVRK